MVSMFMALPAGVPTPPMRQAMLSPSITALPKLLVPFTQPFFSSSRTATGSIMATTGMSARMVESSAQTIIRSSRRRTGEPLDRRLVHRTMRRLRPEFWKAMAMQNMANTKKIVGVANSCIILGRGRMPATAGSTANSTEATATGSISNTHISTAANIMAMARLPLGDSPSGHGRETSRKYPRRMARPMQPFAGKWSCWRPCSRAADICENNNATRALMARWCKNEPLNKCEPMQPPVPRGGGRPRGSAPGNPGRGAASTLRKARAAP